MTIHFLLTPDKSASRKVRRAVADQGARLGVLVGTWTELANLAQRSYLLPSHPDEWTPRFDAAITALPDAFWQESLKAAPTETASVVENALVKLLESIGTGSSLEPASDDAFPPRLARRQADLARLHEQMGFILPPHLALIRQVLDADATIALNPLAVYHVEGRPDLDPWQRALLEKLARECPDCRDQGLQELLHAALAPSPAASPGTSLHAIQHSLFDPNPAKVSLDPEPVQWFSVRDALEELEVVSGMIQKAMREDASISWSDFALLLPSDTLYPVLARSVFFRAGLPLSGLPADAGKRDLGREVLHSFLACCQKPAPRMPLASLLTSPLMPWSLEEGMRLAQRLMDGRQPDPKEDDHKELLRTIERANLLHGPKILADNLERFTELLVRREGMEEHYSRMRDTAAAMVADLKAGGEYGPVFALAEPERLDAVEAAELTLEGIAVFSEQEEPWRRVRRLFVLGFNDGQYPAPVPHSPVFFDDELLLLRERLGYELRSADHETARRRVLFRRQLSAVSERLVFLSPGRDLLGEPVAPSASLPFMASLFDGIDAPDDLITSLATEEGRSRAAGIACAAPAMPTPPRKLTAIDPRFGRDLLTLRTDGDGNPWPESPSGLEKLMISPLAWLLGRSGLLPREWKPESLDVALRGTLAHDVFENLFLPDLPLPEPSGIPARIPALFADAVRRNAPFLAGGEWQVERSHLEREIADAACYWSRFLAAVGATILGSEVWLKGDLDGTPIHGSADLLIALPGNRIMVVDYKKSSSNSRRERMRKRFDSQASLYRIMLETDRGGSEGHERLAEAMTSDPEIGVIYCLLNDLTVLADTDGWLGNGLEGVRELGGDISGEAMKRIRDRILEARKGLVVLNREGDDSWYEKNAGIRLYALDDSPLVRLFMHPAEGGEA